VVHPAGNMLAAGPGGVGALSAGMAGVVAIQDCGHRRGRSPGIGERYYFSTGPTFAWKGSRLKRKGSRNLVGRFRVRNHFQGPVAHGRVNGLTTVRDCESGRRCSTTASVVIG
jgi:hypothetical protein